MTGAQVAGLDLSTKRIGYAAPNGELFSVVARAGAEDPVRRLFELRHLLTLTIRRNPPTPTIVVIEDYPLGGGPTMGPLSRIRLGEIGGAIRLLMFEMALPIVDVHPGTVKRFATGKGNANKERMIAAALDQGAVLSNESNDDEADAFHLRRMGRCAHSLEQMFEDYEREAVATVGGWLS